MRCSRLLVRSRSMRVNLYLIIALVGLLSGASCNDAAGPPTLVQSTPVPVAPATAQKHDHEDEGHDAPRISLADAKKAYDAGEAVMIDVRDKAAYNQERIKGALNIPLAEVASHMDKLPKGKKIIVYCS
jgi:hypothetical protein